MSHDQRPVKMRVVTAAPKEARRRDDVPAARDAATQAAAAAGAAGAAGAAATTPAARPGVRLFAAAVFLSGCAAGGLGAALLLRGLGML